jgi:broad specificity phosphatase PhoE
LRSAEEVIDFVKDLINRLDFSKYKKIHIWVSPFGRTIETAKIIIDELKKH